MKTLGRWIVGLLVCAAPLMMSAMEAMMREVSAVETRYREQFDEIDAREEQERVKLNAQRRQEGAKIQRDAQAAYASALTKAATGVGGGGTAAADAQFAEAELKNRYEHQLSRAMERKFRRERAALTRKKDAEMSVVAAKHMTLPAEHAALAAKLKAVNEVRAEWDARIQDLGFEEEEKLDNARYAAQTRVNEASRAMTLWVAKRSQDAAKAGAMFDLLGDPEYLALKEKHDELRNAMETEQELIQAEYTNKRRAMERKRDDEVARVEAQ
jgi:hypothetical protein